MTLKFISRLVVLSWRDGFNHIWQWVETFLVVANWQVVGVGAVLGILWVEVRDVAQRAPVHR